MQCSIPNVFRPTTVMCQTPFYKPAATVTHTITKTITQAGATKTVNASNMQMKQALNTGFGAGFVMGAFPASLGFLAALVFGAARR